MTKAELHQAIDRLEEEDLRPLATLLEQMQPHCEDPFLQRLQTIPGTRLGAHWPPRFEDVEPLEVEGEPPSEQLIRDRR